MSTLKQLEERAERAAADFEQKKSKLYRADGEPYYGEQEMKERVRVLERERNQSLEPVGEEANRLMHEASAKASRAKNADPADLLSPEELSKANERRPFAGDFAESAEVGELSARCQAVLQGGERAVIFAYWQAAETRKRRILENRRRANPTSNDRSSDLDNVLWGMRQHIVGDRYEKEAEAARAEEQEAMRVAMLASNLKQGTRSAAGAWEKRMSRRLQRAG